MPPMQCEDLVKNIYNFFKQSAKRKTIFINFQEMANIEPHQILHPAQTRWLSFHPAVNRILEEWDALLPFFKEFNEKESFESAERILINLLDVNMKMYYQFLNWIFPKFTALNAIFQSSKVILTNAHSRICGLYKELLAFFKVINTFPKHIWKTLIQTLIRRLRKNI